jgi:ribonucleoside-diphosphate reductase alpha chain
LSEIIARSGDSLDVLKDKAMVATIFGTLQSTLTNFRYLRKIWANNTAEERLLGVSITGIMDHKTLSNPDNSHLPRWLAELKQVCIDTNKEWAEKLGIESSAAITCVKPSGTVSQLCNTASGIHARYSDHYIRRVRIDKKDPLGEFMQSKGFPCEDDVMNSENFVFSFPIKSPAASVKVKDIDALKQLEVWKMYQDHWCEHKPSCTVYYNDDNFIAVGAWVWENFDNISGISFLPYSGHIYDQAPYESVSEEKHRELAEQMPKGIDWNDLGSFESEDNTAGSQTYACTGGACEIVDLVADE